MFRVVFYHPEIPGNAGNAIRMTAGAGCSLHLIEPLGFSVDDAKLRRAGLDYWDRAALHVHPDLDALWVEIGTARVFAFTTAATTSFETVRYQPGDVLLFGPEAEGLPEEIMRSERITEHLRIPMLPGIRSMNLSNSAAVAVYEAWRQQGYANS